MIRLSRTQLEARGLDARPRPAAAALHFAALEREADIVAAGIAGDDLEFCAEHRVDQSRELVSVIGGAGRADRQRLCEQIVEFRKTRRPRGDTDAHFVIGAADPGEFRGVELRAGFAKQGIERGAAAGRTDDRAVIRRRRIKIVGEAETAGAFHILRHDGRIAGNVAAEPARDQARIKIVTAADAVADVEIDRLAAIEIGDALRVRRDLQKRERKGNPHQSPAQKCHTIPLVGAMVAFRTSAINAT